MRNRIEASAGFTLIELMVTLVVVAILASVALPMTQIAVQRSKEQELRAALRQIREALDAYKQAADEGRIAKRADESGYPTTLDALVDGVDDLKDPRRRRLYFLRALPRDPFYEESGVSASETWGKRSYASTRESPREGDDVFDVYSKSEETGLNEIPYREW